MKKKIVLFSILYYILFLLCYIGFAAVAVRLLKTNNLAAAVVRAAALLLVLTPAIILVFARFSLLRWYVDPFAAAIVPAFFYVGLVVNETKHSDSFWEAITTAIWAMTVDTEAWLLLIGLFLFGLLASFSPARKNGKSISYKLLNKISSK